MSTTKAAPKRLTAKQAAALKPETGTAPKLYAIAPNLYLQNTPTGSKSFLFIGSLRNEKVRTGLGSWDINGTEIATQARMYRTWSEAVARAVELKELAARGTDPREAEKAWRAQYLKSTPALVAAELEEPTKPGDPGRGMRRTFRAAAKEFMKSNANAWTLDKDRHDHVDGGLNSRTGRLWHNSFMVNVYPVIGDRWMHELTHKDIYACLKDKWLSHHPHSWRVLQRVENVIDWSMSMGYRVTPNPARYDGMLKNLLAPHKTAQDKAAKRKVEHGPHVPSLPWREVPAFYRELSTRTGTDARCLQWLILTAVRSEAALAADWSEIDYLRRTWTVPVERVKYHFMAHTVPLSEQAWSFLQSLPGFGSKSGLMFGNRGIGRGSKALLVKRPLGHTAMYALMTRMNLKGRACPHGFRSSFRVWSAEHHAHLFEVSEGVLGHAVGTATQRAYNRRREHNDHFTQRVPLMQAWSDYLTSEPSSNVVPLSAAA